MKKLLTIWTALACILIAPATNQAAPVPLDFTDTYSQANAYAEAQVYGDESGDDNGANSGSWTASAYAYADGMVEDPPYEVPVAAATDMDVSLVYNDYEYVEISSSLCGSGWVDSMAYGGRCYGQGDTELHGQLTVGTSGSFPPGSPDLTLEVYADGYESGDISSTWSVHFSSSDPANPVDETLADSWYTTLSIPVLAGQVLDVDFYHGGDGESGYDFDGASDLVITMIITPEPATMSLLLLGLPLALRRRRK